MCFVRANRRRARYHWESINTSSFPFGLAKSKIPCGAPFFSLKRQEIRDELLAPISKKKY